MGVKKKYKLTDEFITICDKKLYRIEALTDLYDVEKGEKGGFVESEKNLSQYGNCWVYDNAKVFDNARVYGDATIYNNAAVFGNAEVFGNSDVFGNAQVFDQVRIHSNAQVYGNSKVFEHARIYGNANISGNSKIFGHARIYDNAQVYSYMNYSPQIYGYVEVYGETEIFNNAEISNTSDYIVFKNWWSSGRHFTWTRSNNMWKVGCFHGTGQELITKAYEDSELSGREYERVVKYVESILKDSEILEEIKEKGGEK